MGLGGYLFTLRDELGGVELSDDRLEDLVPDGGEDTLIVIEAERLHLSDQPGCSRPIFAFFLRGGAIHTW